MSGKDNFDIGKAYKDYYTLPQFTINTEHKTSSFSFKASLYKENALAALKYLSFTSIITPFAVGLAYIVPAAASKARQSAKYGFEVVAFKALLLSQILFKFESFQERVDKGKSRCDLPYETWTRTFPMEDGINLEGAYLPGKTPEGEDVEPSAKTMIYFVGNGEHFAQNLHCSLTNTFRNNGYNIILFNYRGVGESTGHATKEGLFTDAETMYQHALTLGVRESDILLFGHSIGAAIASSVALNHQDVKFCHERSFTQLDKGVTSFVESSLGSVAGRIAGAAIRGLGLNIDSVPGFYALPQENRLAVFHPNDQVINEDSSMRNHIDKQEDEIWDTLRLTPRNTGPEDPHNRSLSDIEAHQIYSYFHPSF